jgi:hypothetical protein
MVRSAGSALVIAMLLAAGAARAQDAVLQGTYASIANSIRAEYEAMLVALPRDAPEEAAGQIEKNRSLLKMFAYNKAALFSSCAAEAERDRSPIAERVPAAQNLVLRTCVEIKLDQLQKFTQRVAYADLFFPERIAACGEQSRLREEEKMLPPYSFLFLDEPKLYDFARYNECLMVK